MTNRRKAAEEAKIGNIIFGRNNCFFTVHGMVKSLGSIHWLSPTFVVNNPLLRINRLHPEVL